MIVRKNNLFATEEQIQAVRAELGLDAPFGERYIDYIKGVPHGDLGTAITNRKPVIQNIMEALDSNIVAIDYDPGTSEVNQLNRIKLMLSTA